MPVTLTLTGVDELQQAFDRLAPDLTSEAGPLARSIADDAADDLRAAVPVVTGNLRRSIRVQAGRTSGATKVSSQVVVGAWYAHIVEFGSRYVAARPVFVPVIRRSRERFVKAVVDAVREKGLTVSGG